MTQVLVYHWDRCIKQLLAEFCKEDSHEVVAAVDTVEEALAVLRSTLHPIVAILERDHGSITVDLTRPSGTDSNHEETCLESGDRDRIYHLPVLFQSLDG